MNVNRRYGDANATGWLSGNTGSKKQKGESRVPIISNLGWLSLTTTVKNTSGIRLEGIVPLPRVRQGGRHLLLPALRVFLKSLKLISDKQLSTMYG